MALEGFMNPGATPVAVGCRLKKRDVLAEAVFVEQFAPVSLADAMDPTSTTRFRVLLVEDEPGDAMLIKMALRESGDGHFEIRTAGTMAEALAEIMADPPDVVLLDLSLPDSGGMDTVSRIRQAAPQLATVVMTGANDPRLAGRALSLGAQDYLVKGESPGPMVVRAIRYALSRMRTQLERQSLLARLEEEQEAMRREMAAASRMQHQLLPSGPALEARLAGLGLWVDSYFQPSLAIGGDLWGCLPLSGPRIGFFGFDFSGHGVGAALNVFRLHALIHELAPEASAPAALLDMMNRMLCGLLGRGQFATMFLGVLDLEKEELVWSGAGHPRPLLIGPDGALTFLETRGTPLGALAGAEYNDRKIHFPRGSTLLSYSDALVEAVDADGAMLGEEGLHALVDHCLGEGAILDMTGLLGRFFAKARLPLEDDLTILSVSWPKEVPA